MLRRALALSLLVGGNTLLLGGCFGHHHPQLTVITTRQNGTLKICGEPTESGPLLKGTTPEGSTVSVNKADIVTTETNGECK
jgi:hypothetical protein